MASSICVGEIALALSTRLLCPKDLQDYPGKIPLSLFVLVPISRTSINL